MFFFVLNKHLIIKYRDRSVFGLSTSLRSTKYTRSTDSSKLFTFSSSLLSRTFLQIFKAIVPLLSDQLLQNIFWQLLIRRILFNLVVINDIQKSILQIFTFPHQCEKVTLSEQKTMRKSTFSRLLVKKSLFNSISKLCGNKQCVR